MQDHAVGLADAIAVLLEILLREAQGREGQGGLLLVQNTHDHLLAILHRAGGHTKIDIDVFLGVFLEDNTTVLRQAALRDVEVAHDLEARDHGVGDLLGQAQLFRAHAVDPVADEQVLLHRLDVNIGGARDVGILDDAVGQLDDRGGVLALEVLGLDLAAAVAAVGAADEVGHLVDIYILGLGGLGGGLGILEVTLQQILEETGRDDPDLLDVEFGGLLEGFPLGVVQRVGHQHRHAIVADLLDGEDALATDDGIADDLDQFLVRLALREGGDEGQVGELGDEFGGVLCAQLELRVQHTLDERGGVFCHLLENLEVALHKLSVGAGGRLLVQDLDCADDDVGLQRHGQHRVHLEARIHVLQRGSFGSLVTEEERHAGLDDVADITRAGGKLEREQLPLGLLELKLLVLAVAPQAGGIVHMLEGDLATLDEIEGHGLGLKGLDDLASRKLDDGIDILAARSRFRDDFDQEGATERSGEIAGRRRHGQRGSDGVGAAQRPQRRSC